MRNIVIVVLSSLVLVFCGCNDNFTEYDQVFGGPEEMINISDIAFTDNVSNSMFEFFAKCDNDVYRLNEGKDAGYAYYDNNGYLIEYCGRYNKKINLDVCDDLNVVCKN